MSQLGNISANLNFTPGGNPLLGAMSGVGGLAGQYALSYQSALQANQTNYNNIIGGYNTVLQNVRSLLSPASIQPDLDLINRNYTQRAGSEMVRSIDLGKGQTTAATAAQRGASFDAGLTEAKLLADYRRSLAGYETNLGQSQLGFMSSVQAPYPDPASYNQLYAIQQGYAQAAADRALMQGRAAAGGAGVGGGGGGGGLVLPNRSSRSSGGNSGGGGSPGVPSYQDTGTRSSSYGGSGGQIGGAGSGYGSPFSQISGAGSGFGGYTASPYQLGGDSSGGYVAAPADSGFSGGVGLYEGGYGGSGSSIYNSDEFYGGGGDF